MCIESNSAPPRTSITIRSSWLSSQAFSVAASMDLGAVAAGVGTFVEVIISFGLAKDGAGWCRRRTRGGGDDVVRLPAPVPGMPGTGGGAGGSPGGAVGGRRRPGGLWGLRGWQAVGGPVEHAAGHRVGGEAGGGELV